MFYEQIRSSDHNYFFVTAEINENFVFPLHLHKNYEFIFVEEGTVRVGICGKEFDVSAGSGALILPNQPHEFLSPMYSKSWIVIFSSDYVPELKKTVSRSKMHHPVIKIDRSDFYGYIKNYAENKLRIKSVLYEIAAIYCEGDYVSELDTDDSALISRVALYIDEHYTEPITLDDMSRALGYNYRYMSGVVNRFFKLPFPKIVNRYRVNLACDLLTNTDNTVTEIAYMCGFESARSFNRNFKYVTGKTPCEYRNSRSDI